MERGALKAPTFITFEGGEGSGKSTQVKILANRLSSLCIKVIPTREPGGSILSERLRSLILDPAVKDQSVLTEALLFSAARSDHLDQIIRPALKQGHTVICDRFSDSTRVYQGYAGNLDFQVLKTLECIVLGPTVPDLTIIIDLPAHVGLERAKKRNADKVSGVQKTNDILRSETNVVADQFERRDIAYHEKLRQGYIHIARQEPERCVIIDGMEDVEEVACAIWSVVEKRLLESKQ